MEGGGRGEEEQVSLLMALTIAKRPSFTSANHIYLYYLWMKCTPVEGTKISYILYKSCLGAIMGLKKYTGLVLFFCFLGVFALRKASACKMLIQNHVNFAK